MRMGENPTKYFFIFNFLKKNWLDHYFLSISKEPSVALCQVLLVFLKGIGHQQSTKKKILLRKKKPESMETNKNVSYKYIFIPLYSRFPFEIAPINQE